LWAIKKLFKFVPIILALILIGTSYVHQTLVREAPEDYVYPGPPEVFVPFFHEKAKVTNFTHREMTFGVADGIGNRAFNLDELTFKVLNSTGVVVEDAALKVRDVGNDGLFMKFDKVILSNVTKDYTGSTLIVIHDGSIRGAIEIKWVYVDFHYVAGIEQGRVVQTGESSLDTHFTVVWTDERKGEAYVDTFSVVITSPSDRTIKVRASYIDVDGNNIISVGDRIKITDMNENCDGATVSGRYNWMFYFDGPLSPSLFSATIHL
jgi:hypothetical protein